MTANKKLAIKLSPALLQRSHQITQICRRLESLLSKSQLNNHAASNIDFIDSFISIEGKDLSRQTIQKLLKEQKVIVPPSKRQEVLNATHVINACQHWDPLSIRDFKHAHQILMAELDDNNGRWRKNQVMVFAGNHIAHKPPKAVAVPAFMRELFHYIRTNKDISWLIKACVFHYGIQYIHPFNDGNGRIGRYWQHLLLLQESPVFNIVLIGQIIKQHASSYYDSLDSSDKKHNGAIFIEFCFEHILKELKKL